MLHPAQRAAWLLAPALALALVTARADALGCCRAACLIGTTGNTLALLLGLGTLAILRWRGCRVLCLRVAFGAMLLETLLYGALKGLTWHGLHQLPRPSGSDGGFPSGHTAAHVCLAALLTERFPKLAFLWYGWAGLMAWSRVESGAHYPYQVAAGAALGLGVAFSLLLGRRQAAEPL